MTIESPRGLKNNLKQNFGSGGLITKNCFEADEYGWSIQWYLIPNINYSNFFCNFNNKGGLYKRLLFNLGLVHAVIHERKKFGPLGWNLAYEFNNSDFEVRWW